MKKISFKIQLAFVCIILLIGHFTAYFTKVGAYINIAGVIYGLCFIINPVYPSFISKTSQKKAVLGTRIGGVLIVILALLIRHGV